MWPSVMQKLPEVGSRPTFAYSAAMSMLLVRMGTALTWDRIATELQGAPPLAQTVRSFLARVSRLDCFPLILARMDQLLDDLLSKPPPIDYARRRRLLRHPLQVEAIAWVEVCDAIGVAPTTARLTFTADRILGASYREQPAG